MLTNQELTAARDKLSAAGTIIDAIRFRFLHGGCIDGARLLNDVVALLADEVAAIDKAIGRGAVGSSALRLAANSARRSSV